jgi:hypothetical protein
MSFADGFPLVVRAEQNGRQQVTIPVNLNSLIGIDLANRLGLRLRPEGHDLAGACIACKSSDAFRVHQQTGVAHCFSCQGKWSPFQVAEVAQAGTWRERGAAPRIPERG